MVVCYLIDEALSSREALYPVNEMTEPEARRRLSLEPQPQPQPQRSGYAVTGGFCSCIAFHPAESVKFVEPVLN